MTQNYIKISESEIRILDGFCSHCFLCLNDSKYIKISDSEIRILDGFCSHCFLWINDSKLHKNL